MNSSGIRPYRSALVLGLGTSGQAAAELLLREGCRVSVVDRSIGDDVLNVRAEEIEKKGAAVLLGAERLPTQAFDVCIVSPGIAVDSAWVRTVEGLGTSVLSELELGASRCECPLLAVTGSNGKSTLSKLCNDTLALAGRRTAIAGNYGTPLCHEAGDSRSKDWIVVEVSSFQLERVRDFRPRVGVLLNVHPNHLDRHGTMETYRAIKMRLFARMQEGDTKILLETLRGAATPKEGGRRDWVTFGLSKGADYRYADGKLYHRQAGSQPLASVAGTLFANDVMGMTAAAAAAAAAACGVETSVLDRAMRQFDPLPHRMQKVAVKRGVRFVDDSKATTLAAMEAGIEMSPGFVRLIAGGLLKERDLGVAKKTLAKRVRKAYLIGKSAKEMEVAWSDAVACRVCGSLSEAVGAAWRDAVDGETVLLSPGCASFDQFKNFEDRGRQFDKLVGALREET